MTWSIDFSKQALKFIVKHKLKTNLIDEIKNFLSRKHSMRNSPNKEDGYYKTLPVLIK